MKLEFDKIIKNCRSILFKKIIKLDVKVVLRKIKCRNPLNKKKKCNLEEIFDKYWMEVVAWFLVEFVCYWNDLITVLEKKMHL